MFALRDGLLSIVYRWLQITLLVLSFNNLFDLIHIEQLIQLLACQDIFFKLVRRLPVKEVMVAIILLFIHMHKFTNDAL